MSSSNRKLQGELAVEVEVSENSVQSQTDNTSSATYGNNFSDQSIERCTREDQVVILGSWLRFARQDGRRDGGKFPSHTWSEVTSSSYSEVSFVFEGWFVVISNMHGGETRSQQTDIEGRLCVLSELDRCIFRSGRRV